MEKLRQHYRKVEKQDIPASQMAFETVAAVGESGLAASRAQLLKREEELRRKEQEDTERVSYSCSGKMTMPLWIQGC